VNPVRIIGVGSPFGQDRLAWQVIESLEAAGIQDHFPPGRLSLHSSDRPGAALLELMRGAEFVLIVDALQSGARAGTILCLNPDQLATTPGFISSHDFGVSAALELGLVLGDLPARVRVIAVEMDPGQSSSRPLPAALVQQLHEVIINEIKS